MTEHSVAIQNEMHRLVPKIVEALTPVPELILLFGSAARGTATRESDADVIVVWDTALRPVDRLGVVWPLFDAFSRHVDLFVMTPEEWRNWRTAAVGDRKTLLDEGVVLYEWGKYVDTEVPQRKM